MPRVDIALQQVPGVSVQDLHAFVGSLFRHLQALKPGNIELLGRLEKANGLQGEAEF